MEAETTTPATAAPQGAAARERSNHDHNDEHRSNGVDAPAATAAAEAQHKSPYTTAYPDANTWSIVLFQDSAHYPEYKAWQQRTLSLWPVISMLAFIGIPNMSSRFNWQWFGVGTETTAQLVGQLSLVPLNMLFGLHIYSLVYRRSTPEPLGARSWATWLLKAFPIEDVICYGCIVANTSIFIGRVQRGACTEAEAASIWLSQQCNPVANRFEVLHQRFSHSYYAHSLC
jgi:hypothetical protein